MMAALVTGGLQAGIGDSGTSSDALSATAGQIYGTAACATGGRVDLIYTRTYVVSGSLDTTAIKAVFVQCSFSGGGTSGQVNGELALSGSYAGPSQPVTIRMSGSVTTTLGECAIAGDVDLTGVFTGAACGVQTSTTPQPQSPAAQAAVGTYALTVLGASSLPRVVVLSPCIGSMDRGGLLLRGDGTFEMSMDGSFVCANGPGPNVSYVETGRWALLGENTIVLSTFGSRVFSASAGTLNGSSITMDLDVPSSAPDIPPTRMSATFTK
jgi:hypothetical protein